MSNPSNQKTSDLPKGIYTIECLNRFNQLVLNGSCAHASHIAVIARAEAPNPTYRTIKATNEITGEEFTFEVNRKSNAFR